MRCGAIAILAVAFLAGTLLGGEDFRADLRVLESGPKEECAAALARLAVSEEPEVLPALLALIPRSEHLLSLQITTTAQKVAPRLPEKGVVDAVIGAPPEVRLIAAGILQEQLSVGRTEVIAKRLSGPDARAAAELLGATGLGVAVTMLTEAFAAGAPGERVGLIRGLALLSGFAGNVVPHVAGAWGDATEEERTEIVRAMVRLKCARSKSWIVEVALGKELERLVPFFDPCFRQDVLLDLVHRLPDSLPALRRLSDKDFGIEDDDWRRWISRLSAGYEPREGVLPEKVKDVEAERNVAGGFFYGVPLPEGEFVFLLDASNSMREIPEGSDEALIDQVKNAVLALLDKLDEDRSFNVIFFSDRANAFRRNMILPTEPNLRLVRTFIEKIRAGGKTSFEAGLRAALKDPNVTDILLLSDGAPNRGRVTTADDVMKLLGDRRVRIHTIGRTIHSRLLKEISRRTGGRRGVF